MLTRLRKAYTLIGNAIEKAQEEYGDVYDWEYKPSSAKFSSTYLEPYLKITGYKSYPTNNPAKNVAGNKMLYCAPGQGGPTRTLACTADGICFWSCGNSNFTDYNYIYVDLNGINGKNKCGRDIFAFSLDISKKVEKGAILSGKTYQITNSTSRNKLLEGCNKTSGSWSNGLTCFELITRDDWQIKDDYPW